MIDAKFRGGDQSSTQKQHPERNSVWGKFLVAIKPRPGIEKAIL